VREKVTVIGLGRMGSAIVKRLHGAGVSVTVYNRTASKMARFKSIGVACAESIQEAVSGADVVLSCLFDDASVMEAVTGEAGVLRHLPVGACYVSTETMTPATVDDLWQLFDQADKQYLPAAVLGGPKVAEAGKLTMFTSGNALASQRYESLFNLFTEQIHDMGEKPSSAMVMKIAMNYTYVANLELISELYVFTEKHGLPPEYVQKVLYKVFELPGFRACIDKIHNRNFNHVDFALTGGDKDVNVFKKAFTDVGAVPRLGNLLSERFSAAKASGLQDKDWTAIYEIVRKESGLDSDG
jgi:3-hydroxyisobutyrate dehydrogenase-like beta-hydroxyacid dehydrogenase